MPKSKASTVIQIGQRNLVDAKVMGPIAGYSDKYINRLAAKGLIPWHGVRNGVKVYRRYDPPEVLAALAHAAGDNRARKADRIIGTVLVHFYP